MKAAMKWTAYNLLPEIFKVSVFANGSLEKKERSGLFLATLFLSPPPFFFFIESTDWGTEKRGE